VHRTFAIGDIHGDIQHLDRLLSRLPPLEPTDTVVFLGDYIDRGPDSAAVVARVRALSASAGCKVIALRGNHEDAWLEVIDEGWIAFVIPRGNGCLETYRSYAGGTPAKDDELPSPEELSVILTGSFFPPDVIAWMRGLPHFYEDDHAIYVHAGLTEIDGKFVHPSKADPKRALLWTRSESFFRNYRGKLVVIGHTSTRLLPAELSSYTPADPTDLWAGPAVAALDTRCGKGGFLTAVELPARRVYESR
jgi:serine/threonine protein phosphatase 1